jgi:cysteinyl-tRNA synthetase
LLTVIRSSSGLGQTLRAETHPSFHGLARADAIRNELLEKGILLEDSKEGVRWKRK